MTILQALDRYYDRMADRGEVVAPGYSVEPIGIEIVLAADGAIVAVNEKRDPQGRKPKSEIVPKWFARQGNGSTPFFLWDNTAYALGVTKKDPEKTKRDHDSFKALHSSELAIESDPGLSALRLFIEKWNPNQFLPPLFDKKSTDQNVAFRLNGDTDENGLPRFIHDRPAALSYIERLRKSASSGRPAFCLVTGKILPAARLHPKIKSISPKAAEVPLVSFNEDAFESYGQKQGFNAPVSEEAAFRYGAALNRLLDRRASRNRIKIGDATVVFWADTSGVGEEAARAAEEAMAGFFEPSAAEDDGHDAEEAAKIGDALELLAKGRPVEDVGLGLKPGTRFYVLGLAPNAARLSVRYWLEDDFSNFSRRLAAHYRDLRIEPAPWGSKPPSIQRLLVRTTALQQKFENIPPLLAGEVARAVLTGARYPRTLLAAAITRLRAGDNPGSGWHAAVIKACLNRSQEEQVPDSLDPSNPSPAYQLGRLFALLEAAQYAALGRINASIGDRYYGAASATPARVFGPLLRGLRTHLSDARKHGRGGWIEPRIVEVMQHLSADLPTSLRLEDQGRFAVGYYHERANRGSRDAEAEEPQGDEE